MRWNGLPLLIFGSGGISKEVYTLIKQINENNNQPVYDVLGFIEADQKCVGEQVIDSKQVVTCDIDLQSYINKFDIVGVVLPIGTPNIKKCIFESVKNIKNIVFPNIIHPNVNIDLESIKLGMGNVITAGVNLTCDIEIGNFNLLNLNSTIGHDSKIMDFNVINPLVSVSGNVIINDGCLLGTGSQILQQLTIGENAIIGAGAVVVKNVDDNSTVVGIPAKRIK